MTAISMIPLAEYERQSRSAADHRKMEEVCEELGYEPQRVRGRSRFREDVDAREVVARALRGLGWSFPRIGQALGGRRHHVIMYFCGAGKNIRKQAVDLGDARLADVKKAGRAGG